MSGCAAGRAGTPLVDPGEGTVTRRKTSTSTSRPTARSRTTRAATGARAGRTAAGAASSGAAAPAQPLAERPSDPAALPVRPGEDPWTQTEIDELIAGLTGEADRLREEIRTAELAISGLMRDSGDGAGDDQVDAGTKNISREHELALTNNARDMLAQTERALTRLSTVAFGACESCGGPIGKARMQAFPRASLCVECKQKQERR